MWRPLLITRKRFVAAAALFLALGLSGCVAPGPVTQAMVCGHPVTYHPDDLKPCAQGSSACTLRQGESAYHVHYSTVDSGVVSHEIEHVCGMQHREPWVNVSGTACTEVTDGGTTGWKKGDVMCRFNAGPPLRIVDIRQRANIVSSAGWAPPQSAVALGAEPGTRTLAQAAGAPQSAPAPGSATQHDVFSQAADRTLPSATYDDSAALPALAPQDDRIRRSQALQAQLDASWRLAYGNLPRRGDDRFIHGDDTGRRYHVPHGQRRTAAVPLLEPRAGWMVQSLTGA